MKNLLLIAAFIFAAAPAFAQNNSDVDQDGDDNVADVEQTYSGSGAINTSDIDQDALGAGAFVNQNGSGNSSNITQSDATLTQSINGPEDPEAHVDQNGHDNTSTITQSADANSFNLVGFIDQDGDDNTSTLTQEAAGPGFTGSMRVFVDQLNGATSTINQYGEGNGPRNIFANVNQDGLSESTIDQDIVGNNSFQQEANVTQIGDSHESFVTQLIEGDGSTDQLANVDQSGSNQTSSVTQTSSNAVANVEQSGADNTSMLTQGRPEPTNFQTNSQDALIIQSGVNNTSTALQSGSSGELYVDQSGDDNTSDVTQSGFANASGDIGALSAGVNQSGDDNMSTITQSGQLSSATVDQSSDLNVATISQSVNNAPNPTGGPDPTVATASIEQSGTGEHASTITQFGGNSTQSARLMEASSVQSGFDNTSIISQTNSFIDAVSSGNSAMATQTGDSGMSMITQDGVMNTATLMQGGVDNVSDINQMGSGNNANVVQN